MMDHKPEFYYREAKSSDLSFMEEILLDAAAASGECIAPDQLDNHPDTAEYVRGWPQGREVGVIAQTRKGISVGAAWVCRFSHLEELGPDGLIPPEITVGVRAEYRNLGLGDGLMCELYQFAKQQGWQQLSLGVHQDNLAARRLYARHDWVTKKTFGEYLLMTKDL